MITSQADSSVWLAWRSCTNLLILLLLLVKYLLMEGQLMGWYEDEYVQLYKPLPDVSPNWLPQSLPVSEIPVVSCPDQQLVLPVFPSVTLVGRAVTSCD